ncbi:MAG TPA: YihY/virulence factor BrkB family protein [Kofleriaceae bacterium]|jgi:membrane protein
MGSGSGTLRALLRDAARSYSRHSGRMLANSVAFTALLSIAPLLYIALGVAGLAIGTERGRDDVLVNLDRWVGVDGARAIFSLIDRIGARETSGLARILGTLLLLYASTRLFSQIKNALDHMWDVHARSRKGWRNKIWKQLRKRILSLLLVAFVGAQIIAVVTIKAILLASTARLDGSVAHALFRAGEAILSLATTTLTFAALFKVLPDVRLAWRDAWRGALVTAVLFSIGATLVGFYLGHKALDASWGPAASVILVLLWVHYSAQVFFFGAAVTGELAMRRGFPIEPDDNGYRIRLDDEPAR